MNGTEKQVKWAIQIKGDFEKEHENVPPIQEAVFWIQHRNATFEEVCVSAIAWYADMNRVSTPFTTRYSRYGREDALQALDSLEKAIVIDTETNGLQKDKNTEVIELSIVKLDTEEVLFNSLIQPYHFDTYGTKLTRKAQEIHKIARKELEVSPTLKDTWDEIETLLSSYPIIGYNDSFDIPLLRRTAMKWKLQPSRFYSTCAMKLFSAYMNSDEYYTLDYACQLLGIDRTPFGDIHRALADTLATVTLLKKMKGDRK